MYDDEYWQKEIAERKARLAKAHERKKHLKEEMIQELAKYMMEHDGQLPDYDPKQIWKRVEPLNFSMNNYARVVGGGDWELVKSTVQDAYETMQIEAMLAEDEAKEEVLESEPETTQEIESEPSPEPVMEESLELEAVEPGLEPELELESEELESKEVVEEDDSEMSTEVSREELIQELVDFSVREKRFPRCRKKGDEPSDAGKLPRGLEIYKEEIGNGRWSEVREVIKDNLPDNLRYDAINNVLVTRSRGAKVVERPEAEVREVVESVVAKEEGVSDEKVFEIKCNQKFSIEICSYNDGSSKIRITVDHA